jgi:hypothetical protein
MSENKVNEWLESGPVTREILGVWLEILNRSEGDK